MSYQLETNGVFTFSDVHKQSSAYAGDFFLSGGSAEWDALELAHPGKSLVELLALVGSGGSGGAGTLQDSYNGDTRIVIAPSVDPGDGGPIEITMPSNTSPALIINNEESWSMSPAVVISNTVTPTMPWDSTSILLAGPAGYNAILGIDHIWTGSYAQGSDPATAQFGSFTVSGLSTSRFGSTSMNGAASTEINSDGNSAYGYGYATTYIGAGGHSHISIYADVGLDVNLQNEEYFHVTTRGAFGSIILRSRDQDLTLTSNAGINLNYNEWGTAPRGLVIRNEDNTQAWFTPAGDVSLYTTNARPMLFSSTGVINLQDGFKVTSTAWAGAPYLTVSNTSAEWDAYVARVGQVSLLNAIVQAYDAGGGGGGGAPGGTGTQVQYRVDASTFGGMSTASYDTSDNSLIIGGDTAVVPLAGLADLWVCKENYSTLAVSSATTNTVQAPYLRFVRYRGSYSSHTGITTGDWLGVAEWRAAYSSTSSLGLGAQMYASASENWDASNRGVLWQLKVTRNGGTDPITRYRVNGDGSQDFISYNASPAFYIPAVDQGAVFGSDTSDSAVVNGHVYYNSSLNKFRACENGSWTDLISAGGSTSPGGSDTQIQYNNSGSFGGISNLNYDNSTSTILIGGQTSDPFNTVVFSTVSIKENSFFGPLVAVSSTTTAESPLIYLLRAQGTIALPTPPLTDDSLGSINFSGITTNSWTDRRRGGVLLEAFASENWDVTNNGARFDISTFKSGTSTTRLIRYQIAGSGEQIFYYDGTNAALTIPDGEPGAIFGTDTVDPTTVNGHVYYNSSTNKYRACENGAWVDMIGSGAAQLSDLSDVGTSTQGAGRVLIADGSNWYSRVISGAIYMNSSGAVNFTSTIGTTVADNDYILVFDYSALSYVSMSRADFLMGSSSRFQAYSVSTAECNVAVGSELQIPLTVEDYKDSGFTHSTSTNPQNVTIDTTGRYKISYTVTFDNQSSARKNIVSGVFQNGGVVTRTEVAGVVDTTIDKRGSNTLPDYEVNLNAGDVLTLRVWGIGSTTSCLLVAQRTWMRIERVY